MLLGALSVVSAIVSRCREMRHAPSDANGWLVDAAKSFSARSPAVDLPYVYALQLSALFVMESGEQFVASGHLLGGTAWLGGPVLFSLLAHALIGATCLLALGSFMRALSRTFASLVRIVIRYVLLSLVRSSGTLRTGRERARRLRYERAYIARALGRAPPLLQTPA